MEVESVCFSCVTELDPWVQIVVQSDYQTKMLFEIVHCTSDHSLKLANLSYISIFPNFNFSWMQTFGWSMSGDETKIILVLDVQQRWGFFPHTFLLIVTILGCLSQLFPTFKIYLFLNLQSAPNILCDHQSPGQLIQTGPSASHSASFSSMLNFTQTIRSSSFKRSSWVSIYHVDQELCWFESCCFFRLKYNNVFSCQIWCCHFIGSDTGRLCLNPTYNAMIGSVVSGSSKRLNSSKICDVCSNLDVWNQVNVSLFWGNHTFSNPIHSGFK